MKIETKFNVGQRVWVPELSKLEGITTVDVVSGTITGITVEKDGKISYFFDEWCADYYEIDIIAYEDTETLINKIKELDNFIKENK